MEKANDIGLSNEFKQLERVLCMNISRMDDDSIRCILTAEDLEENGLNLEDFFRNSDHAREFLQTIVERAKEEVGYEFGGGALAMQVVPLPQNGLLITFSEKADSFLKGLSEHLKDIFQLGGSSEIADFVEQDSIPQDQDRTKVIENLLKNIIESKVEAIRSKGETVPKQQGQRKLTQKQTDKNNTGISEFLLYQFESLDLMEQFCRYAEPGRYLKSMVYYLPETQKWYLAIWRGRMAEKSFRRFCTQALEYGRLITDQSSRMIYLQEHGQCILEKDAIQNLKALR